MHEGPEENQVQHLTTFSYEMHTSSKPNVSDDNDCYNQTHYHTLELFQVCVRQMMLKQFQHLTGTQEVMITVLYVFISAFGILGNGLVIFVVVRRKEMRTTRNVFIVNLALSNFLLAVILVPFLWMPTYRIAFPYGAGMCKFTQAFPSANIFCSALTVSVIAVDRYFVVVRHGTCAFRMNNVKAVIVAVFIWILSFNLSTVYFLHFDSQSINWPIELVPKYFHESLSNNDLFVFQSCRLSPVPCYANVTDPTAGADPSCVKFYEAIISATMAVFIYLVPMPVLIIFSCLLTRFLARNSRQNSSLRQRAYPPANLMAASAVAARSHNLSAALLSAAGNMIGRQPMGIGAQVSAHVQAARSSLGRRRNRTASLLFAMAFSNAVLWLPFIIISLFLQLGTAVSGELYALFRQLDEAAKLISMLSICVNPLLYGYLNTNFNREFRLIFARCSPCCGQTLQNGHVKNGTGTNFSVTRLQQSSQRQTAVLLHMNTVEETDSNNSVVLYAQRAACTVLLPINVSDKLTNL